MKSLLKALLKTGSGSLITILLGIVSTKILAVILGPSGVGLFSLIKQTLQTSTVIGTLGGQTAIVQGSASREGEKRTCYLANVLWIFLFGAVLTAFVLIIGSPIIANLIFPNADVSYVRLIQWLAVPVTLSIALVYLQGVLNGFRAIGRLATVSVVNAIAIAIMAYPAAKWVSAGQNEAFVFLLCFGLVAGFVLALIYTYQAGWLISILSATKTNLNRENLHHFFSFAGTTLVTGLAFTGTVLAIRALTVQHGALEAAGIFDAAWTLSMTYVMLILSAFGTYYLPSLSAEKDEKQRDILVNRVLRVAIILMVILVVTVITFKPLVIEVLYSHKFEPALEIIRWMLIGDYFKVTSWCFGMILLANMNMRIFFWKQIILLLFFFSFSYLSLKYFTNMQGIGVGFMVMNILNLAFLVYYTLARYHIKLEKSLFVSWFIGLGIVLFSSWITWSDTQVKWKLAIFVVVSTVIFSWYSLNWNERQKLVQVIIRKSKDTINRVVRK
jgi:O-antigen/teichoic acid export membrane protein